MDTLIDFCDLVGFGSDAVDGMADIADFSEVVGFADLADGIDFLPLDSVDVAALVDLDPTDLTNFDFDVDAFSHVSQAGLDFESTDLAGISFDELAPESMGDAIDTAFFDALHSPDSPTAFAHYVASTLDSYPDHLLEGLGHVDVDVTPVDGLLGQWTPHSDGTFDINLWNHVDQLPSTTHHEIGHHIFSSHADVQDSLAQFMKTSPIMENQGLSSFLSQYPTADRPAEFVAQIFSFYKTKPELLQALYPDLFHAMNEAWGQLASGGLT